MHLHRLLLESEVLLLVDSALCGCVESDPDFPLNSIIAFVKSFEHNHARAASGCSIHP
jgi:hypothetical protein